MKRSCNLQTKTKKNKKKVIFYDELISLLTYKTTEFLTKASLKLNIYIYMYMYIYQ